MDELEKARCAEEASYFMTVTIDLPSTGTAVSMHFSQETGLIFVSLAGLFFYCHQLISLSVKRISC